ncbi:MAG: hypothetical protein LC657_08275 [Desulfobacteraceae bacterium]|nr:hypothetical protein [Desulfobacteraceae bacterium]
MANTQESDTRFTGNRFLLSIAVWFVVCLIIYGFINMREHNHTRRLILTGVAISKDISSQSGLPLLEKNFDLLGRFLEEITAKPGVMFASIIDHKNKLIAYTDQDQFLTLKKQKSGALENVGYWRISGLNNQKVMNFSSEITFSDTRVGEVFISLAAENLDRLRRVFAYLSITTLIIIFILFGGARYRDCLVWLNEKTAAMIAKQL